MEDSMKYKYIFFDLDGTLTDSAPGITNSVAYALKKYGIDADPKELIPFVGPPLITSFKERYGFSEEQAREAVVFYREYFADKGLFENIPYDGIADTLRRLREKGYKLVTATSKPEVYAVKIMEHFGLAKYFELIAGSSFDETRTEKYEVIEYAIEKLGIGDRSSILMVGDRWHDVSGAKEAGMDCVAVLYGYGDRTELEGANYFASSPIEVADVIESF